MKQTKGKVDKMSKPDFTPMLIGSRAMDYWFNGKTKEAVYHRKSDWDFIVDKVEHERMKEDRRTNGAIIEHHDLDHLNNLQLYDHYMMSAEEIRLKGFGKVLVAPLEMLYVLKRSHAWRARNFDKTITHLWKVGLVKHKPEPNSWGEYLLDNRKKLTMTAYPQRNPNLNQSVEDFFDDPVNKVYNHDWLHTLYAYGDEPMYKRMQPNPDSAWCDKSMWENNMTDQEKSLCVAEECYVIATERFMVPNNFDFPSRLAFLKALSKVCTTLCSGWFRDWAIDHFDHIFNLYDSDRFVEVEGILKRDGHNHPHVNGE